MKAIDDPLTFEFFLAVVAGNGFVISTGSVDVEKGRGHGDRDPRFLILQKALKNTFSRSQVQMLLQIFFEPVHLHGELSDLPGVCILFLALCCELLLDGFVAGIVKDEGGVLQELLLPVAQEIRLDIVLHGNGVDILLTPDGLEDEIGLELGIEGSFCTRHDDYLSAFCMGYLQCSRFIIIRLRNCLKLLGHYI